MFLLHAVLPSAEAQSGGGAEGERADVGEIPFGESLERSRVHKWTSQLALRRLPFRSSFSSKFSTSRLARFGDRAEFIERFSTFFFFSSFFLSFDQRSKTLTLLVFYLVFEESNICIDIGSTLVPIHELN